MSILSAQSIRQRVEAHDFWSKEECQREFPGAYSAVAKRPCLLSIVPFYPYKVLAFGASYGLTCAGYDIRVGRLNAKGDRDCARLNRGDFLLCASMEYVKVPDDLQVIVHDKSSWARRGLAIQNTVLEPGWEGYITLELSNHGRESLVIHSGQPIAQLVFHQLDFPTDMPYKGKYQNQGPEPTPAKHEESGNEGQVQDASPKVRDRSQRTETT